MLEKIEKTQRLRQVVPSANLVGLHSTFEGCLGQLASAVAHIGPSRFEAEASRNLQELAPQLGAERFAISEFSSSDENRLVPSCWGNLRFQANGNGVPNDPKSDGHMPWLHSELARGEVVAIANLDELPKPATTDRHVLQQMGVRSAIWVPMMVEGSVVGSVGLASLSHERGWPELTIRRCQLVADILGNALVRMHRAAEIDRLAGELRRGDISPPPATNQTCAPDEIIGASAALQQALAKVTQVAPTDSTVLIVGETGTGKELLARAIHNHSPRRDHKMVTVNCAALPSSLVEAELFGREKGAFTGALTREPGRFEIADGSTIFLDEIGELSLEVQAKLLRVLQDGEFERLGSAKTRKVDVRLIAATNRNLAEMVEGKEFREDLYYRLNVFPLDVPPLRERHGDIPKLVWAFVREFSESMGKRIETIPRRAMAGLERHGWPGNVRELRNVIERAMIVSRGPGLAIELPSSETTRGSSSQCLADVEREHIRSVLASVGWRIRGTKGAAEILDLKPTTLEARMKKLGIKRDQS